MIVLERTAGELRPFHGILAFLNPLFRRTATIVKLDHVLQVLIQIGHNEANSREQLACVPFNLRDYAARLLPRSRLVLKAVIKHLGLVGWAANGPR